MISIGHKQKRGENRNRKQEVEVIDPSVSELLSNLKAVYRYTRFQNKVPERYSDIPKRDSIALLFDEISTSGSSERRG